MKINTKHIGLCLLLGAAMSTTSCNDLLDLDPVSQITPESFYTSADQLATYLNIIIVPIWLLPIAERCIIRRVIVMVWHVLTVIPISCWLG
jgi:hypothetical protein